MSEFTTDEVEKEVILVNTNDIGHKKADLGRI
jgi:hypothetical protein